MTIQSMYIKPPSDSEDTLVLTLMCPSCETYRSFRFAETLKGITSRKQAGMAIEASCNECRHEMKVSLFWASDRPGFSSRNFSSRNPVDSYEGEIIQVIDPMPMMKEKDPKPRGVPLCPDCKLGAHCWGNNSGCPCRAVCVLADRHVSSILCARCERIPKQKDSKYCPTCQAITEEEG